MEQRREQLRQLSANLGYSPDMVRWDFPVWVESRVSTADMVAFSRPHPQPQDQTTSALVGCTISHDDAVERAFTLSGALAAPAAALADDQGIALWSVGANGRREHLHSLSYEDVGQPPTRLIEQLGPRNLLAAKRSAYQQALFPTDVGALLQEARSASATRLVQVVEHAASELSAGRPLASRAAKHGEVSRISRLLVGAIAALMVSDKVLVDREQTSQAVLDRAVQRFGNYFAWTNTLTEVDHRDLLWAIDELGRDVSYAGLDPTVVATVYESAILDAASKADFGVFYTPPSLASTVLSHIPLEEIHPSRRHILDPSCGSGTFLLAGYDRLRDIAPLDLDLFQVHEDTSRRLTGLDIDPLAVEVARLALLLNAMPAGNGWDIQLADALEDPVKTTATVVVSNPPWRDIRSDEGTRRQLADRFVERMLKMVEPNGFLATVVPASWLSSGTSRSTRRMVAAECGIFEIWRLPQDTFPGVDIDVAVVLAQRDRPEGGYVFRRVRRAAGWQARFLDRAEPADENYLVNTNLRLQSDLWLHGPLDTYRAELARLPTLDTIAVVGKGPVPTPPVRDRGGSGDWRWLRKLRGTRAYAPPPDSSLLPVQFPDEFNWRSGDGHEYAAPKVMVSGVRNPDIAWRLKVLPDLTGGIIPRESLSIVVPTDNSLDRIYALCAVLGSSFASCWIDTLSPRSIPIPLLRRLPTPPAGSAWDDLAIAGAELVNAAIEDTLTVEMLVATDRLVIDSYGLPADAGDRLEHHFAGVPAPEGGPRYPARHQVPTASHANTRGSLPARSFGTVLDVESDRLRLWISGVTPDQGEWRQLPPGFFGSHVRAGATFELLHNGTDLDHAHFEFQTEGYLDLDELAEISPR